MEIFITEMEDGSFEVKTELLHTWMFKRDLDACSGLAEALDRRGMKAQRLGHRALAGEYYRASLEARQRGF